MAESFRELASISGIQFFAASMDFLLLRISLLSASRLSSSLCMYPFFCSYDNAYLFSRQAFKGGVKWSQTSYLSFFLLDIPVSEK